MADPNTPSFTENVLVEAIDWSGIAAQILEGLTRNENVSLDGIRQTVVAGVTQAHAAKISAAMKFVTWVATELGETLVKVEEPFMPVLAGFIAPIVAAMFGAEIDAGAFAKRANGQARGAAAEAIVNAFMSSIAGEGNGPAEPGTEGAHRMAGAAVHAALEGWMQSALPELFSDVLPFEIGHFTVFSKLPEEIIGTLGVSRLVRRAISPLVDGACATPMKWAVEKSYRTQLLAAGTIAKQVARGRYTKEQALEELARQGYSDERIEAVLNEAAKFHSVADVALLERSGQWSEGDALQHLQDQGYDEEVARTELAIEKIKTIVSFERELAGAAVDAFAAGRIDEAQLGDYTTGSMLSDQERAQFRELAAARHALRATPISPSEAEACVKAGILAVADYRRALEQAGRTPDAIDALELLLRVALDKEKKIETLRAEQLAEKDLAAKLRAEAVKVREADVAAKQALARRGSLTDLKHAVVTGLIPIARYEEVLTPNYDGDTVQILVDQVTFDRADYVAQQQKRDDAAKRANGAGLSTAQLEAAVLAGVLTVAQYQASLQAKGVAAGDVGILVATLSARKADADKAKQLRDAAVLAATRKHVDLPRAEQLVRAGIWSMAQYAALLTTLGYGDADRAALAQLLTQAIAKDGAAAQLRAGITSSDGTKGLSLDQARRAVILGLSSLDDFERFLQQNNYTLDAQQILIDELRDDVAAAEAAQRKRDAANGATGPRAASLAVVAKAASLGLISPDVYQERLREAGYSDDDVALEMELLATEIAAAQATRARQQQIDAAAPSKGLTLAQLAAAVKAGEASLSDYQARARALGVSERDVAMLVRVLGDELETTRAAKARHDAIAGELDSKSFSLAALEDQVRAGDASLESYEATLVSKGYAPDDAALLAGLLEDELTGEAPPA